MSHTPIALSADYADALITARRAKNWTVGILLLLLVIQLTLFFVARYSSVLVASAATTLPTQPPKWFNLFHYVVGLSGLVSLIASLMLDLSLLLIVAIMLIGRLIGVARLVGALLWATLLTICLFPWQAFLSDGALSAEAFRLTGALFTWGELLRDARFGLDGSLDMAASFLKWFRFVGFPLVSVVILLIVQRRSARGLRLALGEAESPAPESTHSNPSLT